MDGRGEWTPLQEHLKAAASPPFYSAGVTKAHGAIYLRQYRLSQWLAASRGLLQNAAHMSSHPPQPEEFPNGHQEEADELVLARLRKAQSSLQTSLPKLDRDLKQLENALILTRKKMAVRTGVVTILVSAFLSVLIALSKPGHIPSLGIVPRSLQPFIPLLPSPIAILLIVGRERQISAVAAARFRVQGLRTTVESSRPVSPRDIAWLESEEWDGVDWRLVNL